jgi:predicted nucleic acid-binding protein
MIVLDASVAAKVYIEEAGSDEAIALVTGQQKLLAPELIRVEVAAALLRRVRKGELVAAEAQRRCRHWLERLHRGLFALTPDENLVDDAIGLAAQLNHPLQDCLYLAAARRADVPLITADGKFRDRAHPFDSRVALLRGCEHN